MPLPQTMLPQIIFKIQQQFAETGSCNTGKFQPKKAVEP